MNTTGHLSDRTDHWNALQNRIDSFLLDREHTTGHSAQLPSGPEESSATARSSKEGWPYPNQELGGKESGTSFRTWARAGITLAGFGPSSSGSTFI